MKRRRSTKRTEAHGRPPRPAIGRAIHGLQNLQVAAADVSEGSFASFSVGHVGSGTPARLQISPAHE